MSAFPCFLALSVTFTAALAACHHDDADEPSRYEQTCELTCARVHGCVSTVEVEICTSDCIAAFGTYGALLRNDYLGEVEQCVVDARCRDLGLAATDNSCRSTAKARVGASLAAVDFCEGLAESIGECAGIAPETTGCIEGIKIFNDKTLRAGAACSDQPCAEMGSCFKHAFGFDFVAPGKPESL